MAVKFTNEACPWVVQIDPPSEENHGMGTYGGCGKPVHYRTFPDGERMRMNTPYCQEHAEEFSASRLKDPYAGMD